MIFGTLALFGGLVCVWAIIIRHIERRVISLPAALDMTKERREILLGYEQHEP